MFGYWHKSFINPDFSNVYEILKETISYFFINIPNFPVIIAIICAITGFTMFCKKSEFTFIQISTLTFASTVLASILKYYPFSTRMVLFLLPILIILIIKSTSIKKCFISWFLIISLLIPHLLFAYHFFNSKNISKNSYARNMMQILAVNIYPNYIIALNDTSNADFFYYNFFFRLKNKIEYIKPNHEKKETNELLLSRLNKGKYVLFMSYDSNPAQKNIKEIRNWAYKNTTVLYDINSPQSTLMWLILH